MQLCGRKIKCPVCGRLYEIFNMFCGDQSMCQSCVKAAEQSIEAPDTPEQIEKRRKYFKGR
jgi:hypothetical protein